MTKFNQNEDHFYLDDDNGIFPSRKLLRKYDPSQTSPVINGRYGGCNRHPGEGKAHPFSIVVLLAVMQNRKDERIRNGIDFQR